MASTGVRREAGVDPGKAARAAGNLRPQPPAAQQDKTAGRVRNSPTKTFVEGKSPKWLSI